MRCFSALVVLAAVVVIAATSSAAPQQQPAAGASQEAAATPGAVEEDGLISDPDEAGAEPMEEDEAADDAERRLERRQFTPLVTADNMHVSVADSIGQRMNGGLPGMPHPGHFGLPGLANSFLNREVFAVHNRHKGTCLSVKPHSKQPKLVTARCQLHQAFAVNSPLSFHWRPAENNLAYLAIIYNGVEMCARHRWKGTYFYPCSDKSTKYSLGATTDKGQFQIRDAGRTSQCMDAEFHHALRMKHCGKIFRDQRWEKFHIAFMH